MLSISAMSADGLVMSAAREPAKHSDEQIRSRIFTGPVL